MKFSVEKKAFLNALAYPARASAKNTNKQILSHLHLRLEDGTLTVTGTDMEKTATDSCGVSMFSPGVITCQAVKLLSIVKAMPDGTVAVETKDNGLIVRFGRSRFKIQTLPAEDFPLLEKQFTVASIKASEKSFSDAFIADYAMANQDVRYYLNGLHIDLANEGISFVSTDGHRLAVASLKDVEIEGDLKTGIIIPRASVLEIKGLLSRSDNTATLNILSPVEDGHPNRLSITQEGLEISTILIEGKYPDYRQAVPDSSASSFALIDKTEFKACLSRAIILSNEKFKTGKLFVTNNLLKITSSNPEKERSEEEMEIAYSGQDIEIGFNLQYLIDGVNACDSDSIKLGLTDDSSSASISNDDADNLLNVIMPVRV